MIHHSFDCKPILGITAPAVFVELWLLKGMYGALRETLLLRSDV